MLRFLFIRTRVKQEAKDPVQLDLFAPHQFGYEFKVILSNKCLRARKVLTFHNGRGSEVSLFAELKSDNQLDYVPTRTWVLREFAEQPDVCNVRHTPASG